MGAPPLATTGRGGQRTYPWPPDDPDYIDAPSVTTLLCGPAKPAAGRW